MQPCYRPSCHRPARLLVALGVPGHLELFGTERLGAVVYSCYVHAPALEHEATAGEVLGMFELPARCCQ